jgi:hypothetical protein
MISKTQLINSIDKLPENFSIDEVINHLVFLEKIQKGMADSQNGFVNTVSEAKKKLGKWLK